MLVLLFNISAWVLVGVATYRVSGDVWVAVGVMGAVHLLMPYQPWRKE